MWHQVGCRQVCANPKACGGQHGPIYSHMVYREIIKPGTMDEITALDSRSTLLAKYVMEGYSLTTSAYRICIAAYNPSSRCEGSCSAFRLQEGDHNLGHFEPCTDQCSYGKDHMFPCLCNCTMPSQAHRELPSTIEGQNARAHHTKQSTLRSKP